MDRIALWRDFNCYSVNLFPSRTACELTDI
jgi:hypothetical protein